MQQPFIVWLSRVKDGEWILPCGALAVTMLLGGIDWAKAALFILYAVMAVHILREHSRVMKGKDVNSWRLYTGGAFVFSVAFVFLVMPVFALVSYAIFASQAKNTLKDEELFQERSLVYMILCGILACAALIFSVKGLYAVEDIRDLKVQSEELRKEHILDDRLKIQKLPAQRS